MSGLGTPTGQYVPLENFRASLIDFSSPSSVLSEEVAVRAKIWFFYEKW